MKTAILIFAIVSGWVILSQIIAWVITPSKDEDSLLEAWRAVFMFPVALVIIFIEWALMQLEKRLGIR